MSDNRRYDSQTSREDDPRNSPRQYNDRDSRTMSNDRRNDTPNSRSRNRANDSPNASGNNDNRRNADQNQDNRDSRSLYNNRYDQQNNRTNDNGNEQASERDKRDLSSRISNQIDRVDKLLNEVKMAGSNESRKDRRNREDRGKDLEDKRRQLTDAYYTVQRAGADNFDNVKKEMGKVVDDIGNALDRAIDKLDKK